VISGGIAGSFVPACLSDIRVPVALLKTGPVTPPKDWGRQRDRGVGATSSRRLSTPPD